MNIQTIQQNGQPFALVPFPLFTQLCQDAEMLADIRAYDHAKANAGEPIPSAVVESLLDGVPPLHVYRKWRGLTLQQLADATGLAKSYLSEIETGKKTGSVRSLTKLAAALRVDLDQLVPHNA